MSDRPGITPQFSIHLRSPSWVISFLALADVVFALNRLSRQSVSKSVSPQSVSSLSVSPQFVSPQSVSSLSVSPQSVSLQSVSSLSVSPQSVYSLTHPSLGTHNHFNQRCCTRTSDSKKNPTDNDPEADSLTKGSLVRLCKKYILSLAL